MEDIKELLSTFIDIQLRNIRDLNEAASDAMKRAVAFGGAQKEAEAQLDRFRHEYNRRFGPQPSENPHADPIGSRISDEVVRKQERTMMTVWAKDVEKDADDGPAPKVEMRKFVDHA